MMHDFRTIKSIQNKIFTGVTLRAEVVVLPAGGGKFLKLMASFSFVTITFALPIVSHVVLAKTLVLTEGTKILSLKANVSG